MKNRFFLSNIAIAGLLLIGMGASTKLMGETTVIDDFEDAGEGRPDDIQNELDGYWFTYDDRKNNDGNSVAEDPDFVSPGAHGSAYCVHFSYTLGASYKHRFAGMATNLGQHTPSGKTLLDLSDVTSMSLSIKGSGHDLHINFQSPLVADNNFLSYKIEGTPNQWQDITIRIPQDLEAQWSSTVPWSDIEHAITAIQFKASSKRAGERGEIWVDNITLNGSVSQPPVTVVEPTPADMGDVFNCDFEHRSVGSYTHAKLSEDWNNPDFSNGVVDGRCEIVSDNTFGKVLKVNYPAGGVGPHQGGAQWISYFPGADGRGVSYDELWATYTIKLPENFEFARGGKLPGLGGGTGPTGGVPVDGTNGFSARMMWRSNSSGADNEHPYLTSYMYYLDKQTEWGRDLWWNDPPTNGWYDSFEDWAPEGKAHLTPGKWDTVTIKIKMNTPGIADGEVQAWLNGRPVLNNVKMRYRAEGANSFKIGLFYFSTFFGGSTQDWAPTTDQYILFDNFKVTTDPMEFLEPMPSSNVIEGTFRAPSIRPSDRGVTVRLKGTGTGIESGEGMTESIFNLKGRNIGNMVPGNAPDRGATPGVYFWHTESSR